ncbi:MAG: hypothetical protein NCW75_11750 [Phycisphaera sp.]|nr:MAG: hypothetical protein NCW75_11750 [Phycisphaera sp.]
MTPTHAIRVAATTVLPIVLSIGSATALANGERLYFEVSNDLSPSQPTAVVTLWTEFDPADYCFGATLTEVRATDGLWIAPELDPSMIAPGTHPGDVSADGLRVEGIIAGQYHLPYHIYGDPTNPIALWRAEITIADFTSREIGLSTLTSRYDVYPDRMSRTGRSALADLTEASTTIVIVPSPGALIGFATLLVVPLGRRR